ncbi:DUF6801 domain-containing protein [Streptomyces sp. NBC_01237]|uniref:DUF6801 domain-containing protein n=1 Tax=Streptomyces sp. NBC_01237 TaxID=2903790 RepID=UPI002DDA513A|nr:DUF6801 domain-containing protein [Streptomyces sp. NBC_01237]WRZ76104.1 hypothetical protein OG251_33275 [Streptomyces sp. NBC_01237]
MASDRMIQNLRGRHRTSRAVPSGPATRRAVGLTLAAGVAGASVGVFGAGSAAADPVSLELRYVCAVQMLPDRAGTVEIDADVPTSAVVGRPTSKFVIRATVPVSGADANGLRSAGIQVIKGTVDAKVLVKAPGGDTNLKVPFQVARTDVPKSGPFSVEATGVAPSLTFSRPGRARITVGDLVAHVSASGGMTVRLDVPCKLDSGQNNVVASIGITRTRPTTAPTPSKVPAAATSGTTGSQNPSEGARAGAATEGPAGPSGGLATTGSQGVMSLIPVVAGTVVLGALAVAAAFRFRSRRAR